MIKKYVKRLLRYDGLSETVRIRAGIDALRRPGWPYCPPDEGDLLHTLAKAMPHEDALEVGFATGSTALFILSGLGTGRLTSIDNAPDHYDRQGLALVASLGFSERHKLLEEDSILALPDLLRRGARYGLIFLDGWKTFDHVWVDSFYAAKLLKVGGHLVLDDARMPAVRKCIDILRGYYEFEDVDAYPLAGGIKQRAYDLLTGRSFLRPYVVLRKTKEIAETEAGKSYSFWRPI